MKPESNSIRVGAIAIVGALVFRLVSGDLTARLIRFFSKPETMSTVVFLETGTVMRVPDPPATEVITEPATEAPTEPPTEPICQSVDKPQFAGQDSSLVEVNNVSGKTFQLGALLEKPLNWDLADGQPRVLILHTHTTESYEDCSDNYRSLDEDQNLLAIGKHIKTQLTAAGIGVIHDTTLHDYPSYNGSYNHARKSVQQYLAQYPTLTLVLDIHRDAMENSSGEQYATTMSIDGETSAQLMMVVGTNGSGLNHPNWEQNMSVAVKFHAQLERLYPGICRPISLRKQRFNQDLSNCAMLIEVGTAANTQKQAMEAASCLCDAIISLSKGST